jgi:threonine dehydrogenase-like Zn-dependent dehydrogenase
MRSAVLRGGRVLVRDDVPEPAPEMGQVLVEVKACGICGSDLHFAQHGATMLERGREMTGVPEMGGQPLELDRDVFMGHEFSAEVLEAGPDTVAPPAGTLVTSIPAVISLTGIENLAYTNALPAGYSERMLLSAPLVLEVPNGLDARRAALTEPMAVGLHAVNRAEIAAGSGALVLGSGPVGLAVIAALRLRGIEPIVATDFSPARRQLARTMGAHEAVDPAVEDALRQAPPQSRLLVVGVCMEKDAITPFYGIAKELDIRFAFAYDPMEFAATLTSIAEGEIDVGPMITGEVGLDGVPEAFRELANPERHCKILVVPS